MFTSSHQLKQPHSINKSVASIVQEGLHTIDNILLYLKETKWFLYEKMIDALVMAYGETVPNDYVVDRVHFQYLGEHDQLLIHSCRKILSLLNYDKYKGVSVEEEQPIEVGDLIRAKYVFRYHYALALTHICGYDDAVYTAKNISDTLLHLEGDEGKIYDNLEDAAKSTAATYDEKKTHQATIKQVDDHTYVTKITKCRYHEVMKEEKLDPNLFYAVTCHEEFWKRKLMNENFKLTRTQTLVEGAPFCDFCDHDTRFKDTVEHPDETFWQELDVTG